MSNRNTRDSFYRGNFISKHGIDPGPYGKGDDLAGLLLFIGAVLVGIRYFFFD